MTPYQQYLEEKKLRDRVDSFVLRCLLEKNKEGKPYIGSYSVTCNEQKEETHILNLDPKISLPNQYIITRLEVNKKEIKAIVYTNSGDLTAVCVELKSAEILEDLPTLIKHIYVVSQNLEF